MPMIPSSATGTSWFHCLDPRRYRRTLSILLCLCAIIVVFNYAAQNDGNKIQIECLIPASTQVGPTSSNGSNLEVSLALSKKIDDEEALVDRKKKSMKDLVVEVAASIRNIPPQPYILGEEEEGPKYLHNASCARFPTIYDLEFSNTYWQTLTTSNGTLYLYGAYFDIREGNPLGPALRVLGMMDRFEPTVTTYCQIWFQGEKEPVFSKVLEYNWIWHREWGNSEQKYQPYLLACQVPRSHDGKVPASVSLVETPCDAASNNLRVLFNKPAKKKPFVVCVKGLDYIQEDLSVRLVEWIELLGILGADKIFAYEFGLHPNTTKVLSYYQQTGQIDLTPLTLPGMHPTDPRILHMFMERNVGQRLLHELIPLNDCLYRNLYQYEYIAVFDTDEVIMPTKGAGWTELMAEVDLKSRMTNNASRSSYSFRQLHFVDDVSQGHELFEGIPKYLYMLQNVYRSPQVEVYGYGTKCFHNPDHVLTLHNHFPMACLNDLCTDYDVETGLGQLQHYSHDCMLTLPSCTKEYRESTLLDKNIWRYKEELINRSRTVLGSLGFIPSVAS